MYNNKTKRNQSYNEYLKKFDNYIQEILIQLFGKEGFKAFLDPVMPTVKNTKVEVGYYEC